MLFSGILFLLVLILLVMGGTGLLIWSLRRNKRTGQQPHGPPMPPQQTPGHLQQLY